MTMLENRRPSMQSDVFTPVKLETPGSRPPRAEDPVVRGIGYEVMQGAVFGRTFPAPETLRESVYAIGRNG
jgi:hypothetical protein